MKPRHYTTPRLYVESDITAAHSIQLSSDQSHYLRHVMRMTTGADIRLFNGRDGEWLGKLAAESKRSLDISVVELLRSQKKDIDLTLCCAPIKKAHFDYMLEKTTELGVRTIQPVYTSRTQIREINLERCRTITIESAEQSERLTIPSLNKPLGLHDLLRDWPKDTRLIIAAETGEALPVQEAFRLPEIRSALKVALMTGPEGGFSPEEFETLRKIPHVVFIRLGPRILRADTAAIAAVSCWQALCGDWQTVEK